jgi:hypothetical protein
LQANAKKMAQKKQVNKVEDRKVIDDPNKVLTVHEEALKKINNLKPAVKRAPIVDPKA